MALPPTLLFLVSLIPYLPLHDVQATVEHTIIQVMPESNLRHDILSFIGEFWSNQRKDLLSFGILLTLFFSSNGMMGLMRSFDRSLPFYVKRTKLKRRWTAIKLTLMLLCVAIISLAVLIIQTNALNQLILKIFHSLVVVKLLSLFIVLAIIFCCISLIYTYGPSLTHRFTFISAGSVLATIMNAITTTIFFFLINNFIHYHQVYGSIGTLIAFMVWIWLNTMVILIGYELNVSIRIGKAALDEMPKQVSGETN